jgi:2-enoate reductase
MCHANQFMLLDLLRDKKVEFMTNTSLEGVTDEGVNVIDRNFTRKTILCDTVALALGLNPERRLYESLRGESTELYLIGDCKEPHNIMQAIWDGYHIASR